MSEPRTATFFNLLPRERLEAEALRLEHAIARVRGLHTEFQIYDECDHDHTEEDVKNGTAADIEEIGYTCEVMYTACTECCTVNGYQTEDCATDHNWHRKADSHCHTLAALDGQEAGTDA